MNMKVVEMEERLMEELGAEEFLDAILCAMSIDEKRDMFTWLMDEYELWEDQDED